MRSREEISWKFMMGLLAFGAFIFVCVWTQTGDFLGTVKHFAKDTLKFLVYISFFYLVVGIIMTLFIPSRVREKWMVELLRKRQ